MTKEERRAFILQEQASGKSLASIGRVLSLSRERVRQIRYSTPNSNFGGLDIVREKVRIRDNHTCQKCHKKWQVGQRRFDVHHLEEHMESVKNIKYDRTNMDKMITYCHKCHLNLDSVKKKMSLGRTR